MTIPYLREKPSGFYWEPSRRLRALGFLPRALGSDRAEAIAMAQQLTAEADASPKSAAPGRGTIAWACLRYRGSRRWQELAPATRRGYGQCLDRIEARFGTLRCAAINRVVVKRWQEKMEAKAPAFAAANLRVLRILMGFAKDEGVDVDMDNFSRLRLHTAGGNEEPWQPFEVSAYCDEARAQGRHSVALAALLALCLAQREGDVLRLPWSAWDAARGLVSLRQRKTGRAVAIPVLPVLAHALETTPKRGTIMVISEKSGRPYGEHHFRKVHRAICQGAGITGRKFMTLRHTGATWFGAAGATDDELRAVTGHKTRSVVARYVRPDDTMARAAVNKLRGNKIGTATENR
ncbi:MAG: tyrosine-type recombinase/integrase [Stellaceae bacterium]